MGAQGKAQPHRPPVLPNSCPPQDFSSAMLTRLILTFPSLVLGDEAMPTRQPPSRALRDSVVQHYTHCRTTHRRTNTVLCVLAEEMGRVMPAEAKRAQILGSKHRILANSVR